MLGRPVYTGHSDLLVTRRWPVLAHVALYHPFVRHGGTPTRMRHAQG
ncbi:MAG: hypothetical protein HLUCCO07_02550 [Rhodobacteraceae bacterium HLUCCO07]|nr:MAG: hypothetical protein HLUCCO07_02550 [Rhodobacteraceae bacterium HLUCCO07]